PTGTGFSSISAMSSSTFSRLSSARSTISSGSGHRLRSPKQKPHEFPQITAIGAIQNGPPQRHLASHRNLGVSRYFRFEQRWFRTRSFRQMNRIIASLIVGIALFTNAIPAPAAQFVQDNAQLFSAGTV